MYQYRVTKVAPAHRAAEGSYRGSSWTSVGDSGKRFSDTELPLEANLATEALYVRAIEKAMRLTNVDRLRVSTLESSDPAQPRGLPPLDLSFLNATTDAVSEPQATTLAQAILTQGRTHGF